MKLLPKEIENIILDYKKDLDNYEKKIKCLHNKILLMKEKKEKDIRLLKKKKKIKKIAIILTSPLWGLPLLLLLSQTTNSGLVL